MKRLRVLTVFLVTFFLTACADKSLPDNIQFADNQLYKFLNGYITEEVMYFSHGGRGEYYFTPGKWTDKSMQKLISVSEDGLKFAKDWLGYTEEKPIAFIFGNKKYKSKTNPDSFIQGIWDGGGAFEGEVFINMSNKLTPSIIVHETTHSILRMQGRMSNFPLPNENGPMFLEEGLCNVIDYLFFLETNHQYDTNRYGKSKENMENYLHKAALKMFKFHKNFENEDEFGAVYPQLMSYETAASFIYYLLEHKGTKEDFMRFFDDINLMEDIYGANMDTMIGEWLKFINP
ncbi:MAG: protein DA1 [Oscillospiraceae bacterium]|nr:protein DA1 [Oscillospiraceae bacterium]